LTPHLPPHPTRPCRVPHQLYSDVVKFALLQLLRPKGPAGEDVCEGVTQPNYTADFFKMWHINGRSDLPPNCTARATAAGRPAAAAFPQPTQFIGDWKLEREQPHLPLGWIGRFSTTGTAPGPLSIVFPVVFSAQPRLEVVVLRSYESYDNATVTLSGCGGLDRVAVEKGKVNVLQGSWEHRFSLPDMTAWDAAFARKPEAGVHELTCLPQPGVTHFLNITVIPPLGRPPRPSEKLAILGVVAC
jgi:hypothetical protein